MKLTQILCKQHLGHMFKCHWLLQGRKRLQDTGGEALAAQLGIPVFKPEDILSPPFTIDKTESPPIKMEDSGRVAKQKPLYVMDNNFNPMAGLFQTQLLTNTVVKDNLVDCLDLKDLLEDSEEHNLMKEAILYSHLLDSTQIKLPRIIDIERPGWSFPREYGIPIKRKNKLLNYLLLQLMEKSLPELTLSTLIEDCVSTVFFDDSESGKLLNFKSTAGFMLLDRSGLDPWGDSYESDSLWETEMPDIYPMSKFADITKLKTYELEKDAFVSSSTDLLPQTLFIHYNSPTRMNRDDQFTGQTLMNGFTHCAAFARTKYKIEYDDLAVPVTLNVVHSDGQFYQVGIFQLNSLNLTGSRRNFFIHTSVMPLFSSCKYEQCHSVLEDYNPVVFACLRALHSEGLK